MQGTIKLVMDTLGEKFCFTESYHQDYSSDLIKSKNNEILSINNLIEKQNLIPIGGRDNHKKNWLTN